MVHIKKATELLQEIIIQYFEEIDDTTTEVADFNQSLLLQRFSSSFNLFFKELNHSVFSGEYCLNKFHDSLNKLQDIVDNSLSIFSPLNISYKNVVWSNEISENLKHCINVYKRLYSEINTKVNTPSKIFFLNEFKRQRITNFEPEFELVTTQTYQFEQYNVELALVDLNLMIDKNLNRKLLIIRDEISKEGDEQFKEILLGKCNFLLYKHSISYNRDKKNYIYSIDFKDKEYSANSFYKESRSFKKFAKDTKFHYSDDGFTSDNHTHFNKIKSLYNGKSSIHFHGLIKYYKDISPDEQRLIDLEKPIYNKNHKTSNFNLRSQTISVQYYENNLFSFKIEKWKSNDLSLTKECYQEFYQFIKDEFLRYKQIQNETIVKNYFPYYKILRCGFEVINPLFDDFVEYKHMLNQFIDLFEEVLKELYETTEWCKDRSFLAFQGKFEDCCIKDDNNNNLFLYSSCILPLNYTKLNLDNQELREDLRGLKSLYKSKESINFDIKQLQHLKIKVEENERKNIEILSIFAAIVLFVTSNISIYGQIETFGQGLRFMLIMAYIICIFVIMIWLITRSYDFYESKSAAETIDKIPTIHRYIIGILFIATIFVVYFAFKDDQPLLKSQSKRIDKIEQILKDSIQ